MKNWNDQAVRAAIDDCLSGVDAVPSVRADVLNQLRGEKKVKSKFSVGVIMALLLTLLMAGAAVAAGLGLFGQIGEKLGTDERLPGLDAVSETVGLSFTTEEGVTVTISQAYYDGTRIFISYTKTGPFDVLTMGEGRPEGLGECDWALPGEVYGEYFFSESASYPLMKAHLDGSAPRWATSTYVNVHDVMKSGETDLEIIGGDTCLAEDGTMIGWKECVVPEELAADEVTFLLGTFTSRTTYFQDETGLYLYHGERPETVWHPFTVKKDATGGQSLTGTASGAEWTAEAAMIASAVDLLGEIVLRCPDSWVEIERTWENPANIDYIRDWRVYIGGERMEHAVEWIHSGTDGQLTFGVCCRLDDGAEEMKLVPVYSKTGERPDEAILLNIAQ